VILADSSDDGTADIISKEYPWVHLVRLQERTFPGPARNIAVAVAQGTILAFVDTDCTVAPDWIERILAAYHTGWPIVAGAVLNGTPRSYVGTAEYFTEFSEFFSSQQPRDCRTAPTCNLSIWREIFEAVGGFVHINTAEDLLLCSHLRKLGYTVRFDPKIKVYHHNRTDLGRYLNNQLSLGFGSAIARRLEPITGSMLVRSATLRTLIPLLKAAILIRRIAGYGIAPLLNLLYHLPLIFLGSCYYAVGFFSGARVSLVVNNGQKTEKAVLKATETPE
jgi:GT2 family glycosyltransferase